MAKDVDWIGFSEAAVVTAVASAAGGLLVKLIDLPNVAMVYLLGVAFVASRRSKAAGVVASVLAVLAFDFFFVPPSGFSLLVADLQAFLTFLVMLVVSLLISTLATRVRKQSEVASFAAVQVQTEKARADLLSAVSHDLRTPLATIEGSASALMQQGELSEQSRQLAGSIVHDSRRLSRLVSNLLDMTRVQGRIELDADWYALDELVANAIMRTEPLFDQPITLLVQPETPLVWADGVLVEQVFVNLLENAARHAGQQAKVNVEIGRVGDMVEAVVTDNGPGLPTGAESKVFERFWGAPGMGAGLGLAICRAAVVAHGGTISARNVASGGARFAVALPTREVQNA